MISRNSSLKPVKATWLEWLDCIAQLVINTQSGISRDITRHTWNCIAQLERNIWRDLTKDTSQLYIIRKSYLNHSSQVAFTGFREEFLEIIFYGLIWSNTISGVSLVMLLQSFLSSWAIQSQVYLWVCLPNRF
jgi:hypothetical protein